MEYIERAAIKGMARTQLKGNLGIMLLILILYAVILGASGPTAIGPLLLTGPLSLGLAGSFLMLARGQKPGVNNLFDGFRTFLGPFVASLLTAIFVVLWSLLLIVPGIIAALRYSQVYYILRDNPELDGLAAIDRSKEMMRGHKGEYFVLLLSFFWWYCLCILTLGIACLYVWPYTSLTLANYYEELKKKQGPGASMEL
jgi:Predicted integral membrane protein